jgi:hypothetical protein
MARRGWRFWLLFWAVTATVVVLVALYAWRDDILEALLDPQVPYTVYRPPPPPDYAKAESWDQLPKPGERRGQAVDIFFIHSTTYDGGRDWNGPTNDSKAHELYQQVVAPNYAAPFAAAGAVFAPRYRQASLYTSLSLFDDAIEAREFAYGDVKAAFDFYLAHANHGRPFILVGVEQGGVLADRLISEEVAPNPANRDRLVAAYLVETVVRAADFEPGAPIEACARREESGCVVAWISAPQGDFPRILKLLTRSRVWGSDNRLEQLAQAPPLCVNPLLGGLSDALAPARHNLGAANATGLEWGVRPGFMARQVSARCVNGVLQVSRPRSASLQPQGSWADRLRAPPFNLFWADLEADALARTGAWRSSQPHSVARQPANQTGLEER